MVSVCYAKNVGGDKLELGSISRKSQSPFPPFVSLSLGEMRCGLSVEYARK